MDSLDMFSSRHRKNSTTKYCFILLSFLEMFKAGYCLFPVFNKIHLVQPPPKYIDSLLYINRSSKSFFDRTYIFIAEKNASIICLQSQITIVYS